ncbi:hypothetical protein ACE15N_03105 [Xanthomonas campestris pv. passiflorae]|uniref:hypothetical protein n=1 Tax=Xanthomonas TaxID=338 RepID=UPI00037289D4|nr:MULTISPECIES: hypothetical protein [Xanthomonas]MBV6813752.1 hypothetical protein [Xanthomonas campestris pv. passiflorae]MCC8534915.1 hypothetical protein [Xanthomonas phaseoli]
MPEQTTTDSRGLVVRVGTRVHVLHLHHSTVCHLPQLERDRLFSMVGDTFEVYEVDRWGQAWVEKQWHQGEDLVDSHSLGLEPQQMLAVQDGA